MNFRISHIQEYERFLAIDIGSYRVRAGIYRVSPHLEALGFGWARQNKKNIVDGSIADLRGVAMSLERALLHAAQGIDTVPDDIILGFSSSTFISDIITTQYTRSNKEKEITMGELDTIIKKVEKQSFDHVKSRARDQFGIVHDDMRLVSSTITSITIDGKNITNPVGFGGLHVKLSVLNIFAPASEFNVIKSLASHTGKQVISVVPTPLVFPKILEKSDALYETAYIIDIGQYHTTLLVLQDDTVRVLETFSFGVNILFELLGKKYRDISHIQIESLLMEMPKDTPVTDELNTFFEYLFDAISMVLSLEKKKYQPSHIFLHGGVFGGEKFCQSFGKYVSLNFSDSISVQTLAAVTQKPSEEIVSYGLALLADELLVVKKDPIVRILRYVLYNYE